MTDRVVVFKQWSYLLLVAGLVGVAVAHLFLFVPTTMPNQIDDGVPAVHDPAPVEVDARLRNPFVGGAEWREAIRRSAEPPPVVSASPSTRPPKVNGEIPAILGVMVKGGRHMAILSDRIVGEGDTIGDFRVVKLSMNSVTLSGPGGVVHLSMGPDGMSQNRPSPFRRQGP